MTTTYEEYMREIAEMAADWDDVELRLQMRKDGFDDRYIPQHSGHPATEPYRKDDEDEEA